MPHKICQKFVRHSSWNAAKEKIHSYPAPTLLTCCFARFNLCSSQSASDFCTSATLKYRKYKWQKFLLLFIQQLVWMKICLLYSIKMLYFYNLILSFWSRHIFPQYLLLSYYNCYTHTGGEWQQLKKAGIDFIVK